MTTGMEVQTHITVTCQENGALCATRIAPWQYSGLKEHAAESNLCSNGWKKMDKGWVCGPCASPPDALSAGMETKRLIGIQFRDFTVKCQRNGHHCKTYLDPLCFYATKQPEVEKRLADWGWQDLKEGWVCSNCSLLPSDEALQDQFRADECLANVKELYLRDGFTRGESTIVQALFAVERQLARLALSLDRETP